MSNGVLPQWKRELLQRRAARARPPLAPPVPPAPPPPPTDDDEELRYGPGIVKRLKSRYLSLALREAPRRRPSVLRRATSLEHLLDERPPPAPRSLSRPARPLSLAAPSPVAAASLPLRRDCVKRARSVDALSRLDTRDEPPPPAPPHPPPPPPPLPRSLRPPRRPTPLLRDAERPPADVVRSTLRKFEAAPPRRTAPAARISAVLRGLETAPRSSTPEPRGRSPSRAAADISGIDEPEGAAPSAPRECKAVSRAALEGIARAGSSVRYSFAEAASGAHSQPVAAANPVLLGRARASASPRRVGVIRPMPAPDLEPSPPPIVGDEKPPEPGPASPSPFEPQPAPRKEPPPAAAVEPVPRPSPEPETGAEATRSAAKPTTNGRASPPSPLEGIGKGSAFSKFGTAGIERAWTGAEGPARGGGRPSAGCTSVVFNFCGRKEVPDYIENDGIVLRAARRSRGKAGEAAAPDSDSESESRAPSPCAVRFVNDNVLINGRSSMAAAARARSAKLKLQFDDSLTRTFEYPAEAAFEEGRASPPCAPPCAPPCPPPCAPLGCAGLASYTPSKTRAEAFALGTRPAPPAPVAPPPQAAEQPGAEGAEGAAGAEGAEARPWSEARALHADLLF